MEEQKKKLLQVANYLSVVAEYLDDFGGENDPSHICSCITCINKAKESLSEIQKKLEPLLSQETT